MFLGQSTDSVWALGPLRGSGVTERNSLSVLRHRPEVVIFVLYCWLRSAVGKSHSVHSVHLYKGETLFSAGLSGRVHVRLTVVAPRRECRLFWPLTFGKVSLYHTLSYLKARNISDTGYQEDRDNGRIPM